MADIKVGIQYSRYDPAFPVEKFGQAAEELGFDSAWVAEGLANETQALDIMMALSTLVHHTRRIMVGTGVVLVPLRSPALLAKEVATLDFLSDGRVMLGIGAGGPPDSNPASFHVAGVDMNERGPRCDEGLEIITKLLSGSRVSHSGRFYRFQDIVMEPPPIQRPHPPIWAGGAGESMLKRTIRWCDGFIPVRVSTEQYAKCWDKIRRYADEYQRDVSRITKAVHLFYSIAGSSEEARKLAEDTINMRRRFNVSLEADGRFAFGTVDDCLRTVESFVKLGITHIVFNALRPAGEILNQIERLATEIVPRFR